MVPKARGAPGKRTMVVARESWRGEAVLKRVVATSEKDVEAPADIVVKGVK
jgi:hypothetical protein